jgi:hypothetical protein
MVALTDLTDCVIDYADENMFLGDGAGTALTSGIRNTALGDGALDALTSGNKNIAR